MSADEETKARLNAETGRIRWSELERHFARGATVTVSPRLDLVEVAAAFVADDSARVAAWMEAGEVARTADEDARRWAADDAQMWAVVASPWVLVQEGREVDPG